MENVQKEQILFITDITNFLVESIKGKLEHLGYRVVVSKLNIEEIRRCKGLLGAILIHVQENMAVKTKELTFLNVVPESSTTRTFFLFFPRCSSINTFTFSDSSPASTGR